MTNAIILLLPLKLILLRIILDDIEQSERSPLMNKILVGTLITTFAISSIALAKDANSDAANKQKNESLEQVHPNSDKDHPVHKKYIEKVKSDPRHRLNVHDISWRGKKWEYLVEYPRDKNVIDPQRFEDVLNTAGRHGWDLISVSHENHFYAFYFKRELQHHKVEEHTQRLKDYKQYRAEEMARKQHQIDQAHKIRMKNLKEIEEVQQEMEQADELLTEEVNIEKQMLNEQKKLDKELNETNS